MIFFNKTNKEIKALDKEIAYCTERKQNAEYNLLNAVTYAQTETAKTEIAEYQARIYRATARKNTLIYGI